MTGGGALSRRTFLRRAGLLGLLAGAQGCAPNFSGTRLTVATGGTQGVYFNLGTALAQAWQDELGLGTPPRVLSTPGSVHNLGLLAAGAADVVFSQIDAAADQLGRTADDGPLAPRALARIYDDVVHVVVRATASTTTLAELRGARVSVGAPDSGVSVIATRLLQVAGLSPDADLQAAQLGINESVAAMKQGKIDAFFWSGGLPTSGVTELAAAMPIRLLDLEDVIGGMRAIYPVYALGTVPAKSYGIPGPITTLLVRNVLLVGAVMADGLAEALVAALFSAQAQLAQVSPAALTIDPRAAIGTQPVPLHPGAERFFRSAKG